MEEVIGAIIGALLGGLFMWLLSRRQPQNYILWEEVFSYAFRLPLPKTRILYEETPVDELHLVRLKCRHLGSQVIDNPEFTIILNPEVRLLGVTSNIIPERGISDELCNTKIDGSKVHVSLERIYPHSLNQEILSIDLLSGTPVSVQNVIGTGTSEDGYGWSVKFTQTAFSEIPLLSLRSPKRQYLVLPVVAYAGLILTVVAWFAWTIWHFPRGLVSVNWSQLQSLLEAPLFVTLAIWTIAVVAGSWILGLIGWFLPIPIPFSKRVLVVRLVKRGTYYPWND